MRTFLMMALVGLFGCGGTTTTLFGSAAPATGALSVSNATPLQSISGLEFQNAGTGNITVDQIHVLVLNGSAFDVSASLSLGAHQAGTAMFGAGTAQSVTSVSFVVHGSTEALKVFSVEPKTTQGCGISPSSYDQSCAVDADCVPVYGGPVCGMECFCPGAAINKNAQAQYEADMAKLITHPNVCSCAMIPTPRCVANVCTQPTGP